MLKEHNGTAAIATQFCEGITMPRSMGIGGGFLATIYTKSSGKVETVLARERAPFVATENMFENMTEMLGILSVAMPGEINGYAKMHQKYGRVPWKALIQLTIDLCRSGYLVNIHLQTALQIKRNTILADPSLREA